MIEGFAKICPGGDIVISEEAATYRPEMRWLAARLNEEFSPDGSGQQWRVVDPSAFESWRCRAKESLPLLRALRFAEYSRGGRYHGCGCARDGESDAAFQAVSGRETMVRAFWMRPLREFWRRELSERHFLELQKVIPYTWILDPEPLPQHAVIPGLEIQSFEELKTFSQKQRDLILKISGFHETAWGSRSVILGSDCSQQEWQAAVTSALGEFASHPHILQRFHKGRLVDQRFLSARDRADRDDARPRPALPVLLHHRWKSRIARRTRDGLPRR